MIDPVDDDDADGRDESVIGEERQAAALDAAEERRNGEHSRHPADMVAIWREEFAKFAADHSLAQQAAKADVTVRWWARYGSWVKTVGLAFTIFAGIWAGEKELFGALLTVNGRLDTLSRRSDEGRTLGAKANERVDSGNEKIKANADRIVGLDYRLDTAEKELIRLVTTVTQNRQERLVQIDEIRRDKEGTSARLVRIEAKMEDMAASLAKLEERSRGSGWLEHKSKPASGRGSAPPTSKLPVQDIQSPGYIEPP